jgi:hypothetical protein
MGSLLPVLWIRIILPDPQRWFRKLDTDPDPDADPDPDPVPDADSDPIW